MSNEDPLFELDVPIRSEFLDGWYLRYRVRQDPKTPEYFMLTSEVKHEAVKSLDLETEPVTLTIDALEQILDALRPPPKLRWDHDGHKPVQHRDGKPPWCEECHFTGENPPRHESVITWPSSRGGNSKVDY